MQLTFLRQLQTGKSYRDLTGQRFGNLRVLSETVVYRKNGNREIAWECRCRCRAIVVKRSGDLTSGKVTSCGCTTRKRIQLLGKANKLDLTNEQFGFLRVVRQVKSSAPGNIAWKCHCDRCGNNNVIVFSTNLLSGRTKSCGCVSKDRQVKITINQETLSLSEWSRRSGVSKELISYRLKRGYPPQEAVFKPARRAAIR